MQQTRATRASSAVVPRLTPGILSVDLQRRFRRGAAGDQSADDQKFFMSRERIEATAEGQDWNTRLSKEEAEGLLDWLETHGCLCHEVSYQDGRDFTLIRRSAKPPLP
jgi:hypothetical protein